ncbi:MAG: hypothetical protein SPF41_06475 [Candidatus Merdousia sp.]|nr:hypothetical protein [Candidatus Merdousia sp.]
MANKISMGKSGLPKCPFEVRWNFDGERKRKRFKSRGDAEFFAENLREEAILPDAYRFSPDERSVFASIKAHCERAGVPLADALDFVRAGISSKAVAGCPWADAEQAFIADAERRGARAQTLKFYRSRLGLFAARERVQNIAEVDAERAEKYLAGILSPEHAKRALRAFFNFCKAQKWVAVNPFELAKTPRRLKEFAAPSILSVADTERLMSAVPPKWTPAVAIMAFAGVRPNELASLAGAEVVRVGDIDFGARKITIRAEVSKVRRVRILTSLPDNLWAWIEPLRGLPAEDNVAPASYDVWRRVKRDSGVNLPKDVLRHSFASYAYHYIGAERAVEILGHIGGFGVFAKHYKGLATPDEAKKYFAILP